MNYLIAIDPGTNECPEYGVIVPDLPGCYSQGESFSEAIAMAKESIYLWIEGMLDEGLPIPAASDPDVLMRNPEYKGLIWASVDIDPTAVTDKAERVNITLPSRILRRLDALAEKCGDTRSRYIAKMVLNAR